MIETTEARQAARYSGKHCVLARFEGEPVSQLFTTEREAVIERERLRADYPHATLGYWPTRAETVEYERERAERDSLDVQSYQVVADRSVGGVEIHGHPVSPAFATRDQADERLAAIIAEYPTARIREATEFCRTPEERDRALDGIIHP